MTTWLNSPHRKWTVRLANQNDSSAIRRLVISGGINPTGLDWRRFIVAEAPDGRVIGCGQIKPHRDGSHELASIAVAPEWRERGVARAIIERLLASQDGDLYLMCRSRLGPLYEKFGFQALAETEMPKYFKKVSRLASFVEYFNKERETLLVMKRDG